MDYESFENKHQWKLPIHSPGYCYMYIGSVHFAMKYNHVLIDVVGTTLNEGRSSANYL